MVATIYYEFGPFSVDPIKRVLLQDKKRIPLAAKPFDLLLELIQNAGQSVSKEILMERVWSGVVVSDNTFSVTLSVVRKALGEYARDRQYIITKPDGYCFADQVRTIVVGDVHESKSNATSYKPSIELKQNPSPPIRQEQRLKVWLRKPAVLAVAILLLCVSVFSIIILRDRLRARVSNLHSNVQIIIDGHPHEWSGIKPILTDPVGDGPFSLYGQYYQGEDFINISSVNDSTDLYLLLEFAGDYSGGIKIFLDTDLDAGTGCDGAEYIVFVSPSAPGANLALADGKNCTFKDDFPAAVRSAMRGRFVEASVRIDALRTITPQTNGVRISAESIAPGKGVSDNVGPPTAYLFK